MVCLHDRYDAPAMRNKRAPVVSGRAWFGNGLGMLCSHVRNLRGAKADCFAALCQGDSVVVFVFVT